MSLAHFCRQLLSNLQLVSSLNSVVPRYLWGTCNADLNIVLGRALFWCLAPLAAVSGVLVSFTLPPSKVHGDMAAKIKAIDYYGVAFSSSAILLLLIPISGGGIYFKWSSSMVISMLVLGSICMCGFLMAEWKWAVMPMMPLRQFRNRAISAIILQNFLHGIVYYSQMCTYKGSYVSFVS